MKAQAPTGKGLSTRPVTVLRKMASRDQAWGQGLTLAHVSAQLKRCLWDIGCIQGLFRGYSGGIQGVFRGW